MPKSKAKFIILDVPKPRSLELEGRTAWALNTLLKAGGRGVTSSEHPAPRLSTYVVALRALGLNIETVREKHGGDFPGYHGRYVLLSYARKGSAA